MRIAREEVFGPVLSIIPFEDDEEAIAIANDTPLRPCRGRLDIGHPPGGSSMADRIQRRHRLGEHLSGGELDGPLRRLQAQLIGRENGQGAIDEYLQTKCVWINLAQGVPDPFVMR